MKIRTQKLKNRSPRWKRTIVNTAVAMSLSIMYAPSVFAASTTIAGPVTTPQTLLLGDSLTVTGVGSLIVGGVSDAVFVDGNASIDNSGIISQTTGYSATRK